jgi:hypothetical protein
MDMQFIHHLSKHTSAFLLKEIRLQTRAPRGGRGFRKALLIQQSSYRSDMQVQHPDPLATHCSLKNALDTPLEEEVTGPLYHRGWSTRQKAAHLSTHRGIMYLFQHDNAVHPRG